VARFTVFSQFCKLIPRPLFQTWVGEVKGDKSIRKLDCWSWMNCLLFSQLSGHDSLRSLVRVFDLNKREFYSLGISSPCRSTLSDANQKRPLEILEKTFEHCLKQVQSLPRKNKLSINSKILLIDSTFVRLCLNLCPWSQSGGHAQGGKGRFAGMKIHTGVDLAGSIPEFVFLKSGTEKINGDLLIAENNIKLQPDTTYVFDRAYWSTKFFQKIQAANAYFVIRHARKTKFKVERCNDFAPNTGVTSDHIVYLSSKKTSGVFKGKLRKIRYVEPDTGKVFVFVTNRFDLDAKTICDIYKARWEIEIFFKTIKQNLKIKKFLGLSQHAVKAQIYAALIAYLLISYEKITHRSGIPMADLMAMTMSCLILKTPLKLIMAHFKTQTHAPPPLQTTFNF
jgi:hypothetical protein